MTETALGWWGVPLAVFAGAMRSSTPFLFVSLGELLTEKSGRINLGQEGILVLGAMCGYGVAFLSGSPWLGVLVAGCAGAVLGSVHAALCSLPRVNDIALGIAVMLFGTGLAFYLGKPFIQPQAPRLPAIPFGWWSSVPQVQAALQVNVLFLLGAALAPVLAWGLTHAPQQRLAQQREFALKSIRDLLRFGIKDKFQERTDGAIDRHGVRSTGGRALLAAVI